jgi:type IX secretion system PorP/SprF family membrane protein
MRRKIFLLILIATVNCKLTAQDALFTQFHYAPVYLNPALTGTGKNNLRLSAVTKMQWFNLYKPFKHIAGAVDYSVYDDYLRNVVNLAFAVNHSSKGYLSSTNISGVVGRSFGTNNGNCSNWFLSLALQAGYTFSSVNTNGFVFIDQIDQGGITGAESGVDLFVNATNKNYFDMSSGFVFTWRNWMFGGAVHHLNEPNISFNGKPEGGKLPKKITGHIGYVYDNENIKLKPTIIGMMQGQSKALLAGVLFDFNEFPIQLGCWYRNNLGFNYNNAFSVGFTWKWGEGKMASTHTNDFANRMGISYDAEFNKPGIGTTHGSLELGIQKDIIIDDNLKCPTSSSGICTYKFPWEFF